MKWRIIRSPRSAVTFIDELSRYFVSGISVTFT
jgi:hypothetical protein